MGLRDFVNRLKEQEAQKNAEIQKMEANPRFAGMDVTKIELQPIDGDKDRMALYGCYAGDTFTYKGQTYTVEKDDVERIEISPKYTRVDSDRYRYSKPPKEIQAQWDKAESDARRRMYLGNFQPGDQVKGATYTFTYDSRELTEDYGPHGDYTRVVGYHNGWEIKCHDNKTPMKDIVMPDEFLGKRVMFAEKCFEDCKNIASVAHISQDALAHGYMNKMFDRSGLREVPAELMDDINKNYYKIRMSCSFAYAIHNIRSIHRAVMATDKIGTPLGLYMFEKKEHLRAEAEKMKENASAEVDNVRGEFSPYQKAEKVSFVYDFRPVTIYRAQDMDGNLRVVNPNGPQQTPSYQGGHFYSTIMMPHDGYGGYMSQFEQGKIQGLTPDSITQISMDELADYMKSVYDAKIESLEVEAVDDMVKTSERIEKARAEADKAQEGLDFTPRKDDLSKIEPNTRDEHEEEIE